MQPVITHYLVFYDKTVLPIEAKYAKAYFNRKPVDTSMVINGNGYQISSISKCLLVDEFFRQYPEHRADAQKTFELSPEDQRPRTPEEIARMRSGVAQGLWEEIQMMEARGESTLHARAHYEQWKNKIGCKNGILQTMPGKKNG